MASDTCPSVAGTRRAVAVENGAHRERQYGDFEFRRRRGPRGHDPEPRLRRIRVAFRNPSRQPGGSPRDHARAVDKATCRALRLFRVAPTGVVLSLTRCLGAPKLRHLPDCKHLRRLRRPGRAKKGQARAAIRVRGVCRDVQINDRKPRTDPGSSVKSAAIPVHSSRVVRRHGNVIWFGHPSR